MELKIGDKAPEFESINQKGDKIKLSNYLGEKVVLYFYPRDNTPGCTSQACNLKDNFNSLKKNGYTILGVSKDSVKSHQKFIDKFNLPFDLIADEDQSVHKKYGTWVEKSMYGRTYMGTARWTFLIDKNGNIENIIQKVKTKDHFSQIVQMSKKLNISDLENISSQVRRDIVRMVHGVQSGHPGGSLGCTDFLVTLFFSLMNKKKSFSMDGKNEDIFFLSNGHISPVFYSVLARSGYFNIEELKTFRKIDSRLQGHPATHEGLPGVRVASGSLGQGLSVAIGAAISKKLNNDSTLVYVLLGDGELQEGQVWEALMYAAHNNINNLIINIDYNGQQIDGPVDEINSLKSLKKKFKSFGWNVVESNGNDIKDIIKTINEAKKLLKKGLPVVNIMTTIMGKGVDFMENSHKWHGIPPNDEQLNTALNQLQETLGDY